MENKKPYTCLFLDLDGTLTDSMEGITRSVAYALSHFGIEVQDMNELCPFIGPPLIDSFRDFYNFSEEEANKAVALYRERFAKTGIYENRLYDGVVEFLKDAKEQDYSLILATSKPTVFAKEILRFFELSDLFKDVVGSNLDGTLHSKADVIRYAIETNKLIDKSTIVMIGDRMHDIAGAKSNNIDSIGVLHGFGNREELENAGADYIVSDIHELRRFLLQ